MTAENKVVVIDIAKGTALTYILLLLPMLLPVVSVLNLFVPAPAIYYSFKKGRVAGFAIVALSMILLMVPMAGAAPFSLFMMLAFTVIAVSLPELVGRQYGGGKSIAITVAVTVISIVLAAVAYRFTVGIDFQVEVAKALKDMESMSSEMYKQMGVKEDPEVTRAALKSLMDLMLTIFPALTVIGLSIMAAVNLLVIRTLSYRLPRFPVIQPFSSYRNYDHLIWLLILSGFGMLGTHPLSKVALNVLVVLLFLYLLQGLAITTHFFDRLKVGSFIRAFFYLLLLIVPYMAVAVLVLGIFDLWGNFRVPRNTENL